jgi:hypothetical protein
MIDDTGSDCEILLEDGGYILLEDGVSRLLLETCVPAVSFADAPFSIIRRRDRDDDLADLDEEEEAVLVLVTMGVL